MTVTPPFCAIDIHVNVWKEVMVLAFIECSAGSSDLHQWRFSISKIQCFDHSLLVFLKQFEDQQRVVELRN